MRIAIFILPFLGSAVSAMRKSKYSCEGEIMHLECEQGKYISPVRANFGRFEAGVCNPTGNLNWSTRCIQPTTLRQVNSECNGKSFCSIDVTSSVFGDACPGTYKYLEVHYTCKHKVEAKSQDSNLPPWLLKMTATTAKPTIVASTTSASDKIIEEIFEPSTNPFIKSTIEIETVDNNGLFSIDPILSVESIEENIFNNIGEELIDLSENIEDDRLEHMIEEFLPEQNSLFLNYPLDAEEVTRKNVNQARQNTVLFASLISVLCCTLVIFLAAVLFTKYRQRKSLEPSTPRKELISVKCENNKYHQYNHQTNHNVYDYESSTGTNNTTVSSIYTSIPDLTTVGSIYTTLPNGDKAIIIPMPSNQQYLRQILANTNPKSQMHYQNYAFQQQNQQQKAVQNEMFLQANTLQQLLQPQENLYMDIEQPRC